jgi:NOL1/NOP2/fmu family ribosome biogenesis protein
LSRDWSEDKSFETEDRSKIIEFWTSRFGVSESVFDGYRFFKRAKSIWLFSGAKLPNLSYETIGLRAVSTKENPWKPTTCALQILGKYATKNVIDLNREQAMAFMAGESQDIQASVEPGYVAVSNQGQILGCGRYSKGRLESQLPKERRMERSECCPQEERL